MSRRDKGLLLLAFALFLAPHLIVWHWDAQAASQPTEGGAEAVAEAVVATVPVVDVYPDPNEDELIEAARIDSAGEFTIFHRIVLPDVIPAVSALGIFQFLWVWDDYLWPFLMMQSMDRYTLPVGLSLFNGQYYNDNGGIFAAATISMVRVICFVDVTELMRLSMS